MKIGTPGALLSSWATLLAPRWPKMRFGAHLGLHLDACWDASWRQDGPSWSQDGAMLANLAPRCAQEGELGAYLARFWCILLTFFVSWARSFQNGRKPKKRRQFITFEGFFGSGGPLGGDVGDLGVCWAIWAPSWSNLATKCGLRAPR